MEPHTSALLPTVVLVGLPGSGKSTVGRAVAERLRRPFLDLDEEIERREGMPASEIFARRGEAYFRQRERELTAELAPGVGMILAPGGGWLTSHNMLALLRGRRRIIYLKVRPETALQRLGPNLATRPLLRCADPLDRLRQLLAEREPGYRLADFVIDTDVLTLQEVIDRLALLASADIEG